MDLIIQWSLCLSKVLCAWQMRTGTPAFFAACSANAERVVMCECTIGYPPSANSFFSAGTAL